MAQEKTIKRSDLALVKKDTVDIVASKIREFQERGEIHFPANYSPENAMKAAWLTLQSTVDKDKKPALEVCTNNSIANALLDMVVQGLNPAKKQVYFIVYGKELACQRSYFGTMALCKRVTGAKDIHAQVIYGGDTFEYAISGSQKFITKHIQKLENVRDDNIVAAYCTVVWPDDRQTTDIMTFAEIKQAWKQSKMVPFDQKGNLKADSAHGKFTAAMALKTVINRTCKPLINSSDDGSLIMKHVRHSEDIAIEAEVTAEIEENANSEDIDIENVDMETGEIQAETTAEPTPEENQRADQELAAQEQLGPGF